MVPWKWEVWAATNEDELSVSLKMKEEYGVLQETASSVDLLTLGCCRYQQYVERGRVVSI